MRIIRLGALPRQGVDNHGSQRFSVSALGITADAALVLVDLKPGGLIGRHPAVATQLLVVLDGDATVSGADGEPVEIGPGQAAVWDRGEPHETRSSGGLRALVVEGDVDLREPGHHVDRGDT